MRRGPSGAAGRRPAVVVAIAPHLGDARTLRELLAGVEEEGVPFLVEQVAHAAAAMLAHDAALASTLGVGIGVDADGVIAVHHAKLPADAPALTGDRQAARTLGHNAARLVIGIPFKAVDRIHSLSAGERA